MTDYPTTRSITINPPITIAVGNNRGPFHTLELAEPTAREMRVANGHLRAGVNNQSVYLRGAELISLVTKRLGSHWPVPAVEELPDGVFTEALNFLLGFQERANLRAMKEAMEKDRNPEDGEDQAA